MSRAAASIALAVALTAAAVAQAQPRGYYPDLFRPDYAYRYDPPRAYGPDGRYTPYSWPNGYDGFNTAPDLGQGAPGLHDAPRPAWAWGPAPRGGALPPDRRPARPEPEPRN